jgi:hypothetical protein
MINTLAATDLFVVASGCNASRERTTQAQLLLRKLALFSLANLPIQDDFLNFDPSFLAYDDYHDNDCFSCSAPP